MIIGGSVFRRLLFPKRHGWIQRIASVGKSEVNAGLRGKSGVGLSNIWSGLAIYIKLILPLQYFSEILILLNLKRSFQNPPRMICCSHFISRFHFRHSNHYPSPHCASLGMRFPLNRVVLRALADVDFLAALALTGTSATLRMFIFEEVLIISTLARFLHENQYVLRHDIYHTIFSDKEITLIHTHLLHFSNVTAMSSIMQPSVHWALS